MTLKEKISKLNVEYGITPSRTPPEMAKYVNYGEDLMKIMVLEAAESLKRQQPEASATALEQYIRDNL